jgi:hypothetical protein
MVQRTAIYQKTDKGVQSLATRDPVLTPKLRSMLIMVDGKRGVDELGKLAAALGEPEQLLAQLLALRMVEAVASATPPASESAGLSSAPAPLAAVPLSEAKRFAVRRLTDLLGPTAEDLCLRVESARTAADFKVVVKRAEAVLREFGGSDMAASFARDMQSHRPG